MSFVTYILAVGTVMGMKGTFQPDDLTRTGSSAFVVTVLQVLFLRLGIYLLAIPMNDPPIFMTDLVAYCGYQYVRCVSGNGER
jgi:hypothetical protein